MEKQKKRARRLSPILCLVMLVSICVPSKSNVFAATALNKTSIKVATGAKEQLKVKGTKASVTWSSDNKAIATVDAKGYVKGIKKGSTKVHATVSGKKYTCTVKVESVSISAKTKSTTVGSSFTLSLKGNTQKVNWASSNSKVASVSSTGKVKALAEGKAIITGKVDNKKYSCTVTVNKKSVSSELNSILTAVKKAYGDNYKPQTEMTNSQIEEIIGLKSSLYDGIIAEQPMLSFNVDTFIAVHPKQGKKEEVKRTLANYKKYLLEETMQYPINIPKIQAAKVVSVGDYVFFIMLGAHNDTEENESKVLEFYEKQNDIAINAIKKVLQ